ncbi:aldehyde dehydrogenase [Purpureocillium lilacinum]|uniref:Aldehyde dehydrogenase n=1 Tax=Purpureocillium lilacinum TaxID=33203 RepID=A0A2U3EBJ8_PURLI|nr:aldehyde dehydrogenase [Purpureocillium lilacinum]
MSLSQTIVTPTVTYDQPLGLYIDGKWVKAVSGKTFETVNPTNEKPIVAVHEAGPEDVDIAVKAARKAFEGVWSQTTPSARGSMLAKLADLLEEHTEILAAIESLDNGKALTMAKGDVGMAAGCLRYYGGWADKIHGKTIDTDPDNLNYTRHEAVGVCGQIIPWNFPLVSWSWKIGPALACGNTVVLKTAEQTPLSALYAANLVEKAGFPPGVVNIISGFGSVAGAAIASHMDIDKIAFTGSTTVGRGILQAASKSNLKKITLELGGKSPNIVFNDANIQDAISWVNFGIFFNHGQVCCAGSRVYVQSGIYDKFVDNFKARTAKNIVGNPFDAETFQGPQVSKQQFDRIMNHIQSGKDDGAKVEAGGGRHGSEGYFIQPTVFSNVSPDMKIMQEEIFGPVVVLCKFETEEEAVRAANDSRYGLAAGVHTTNINTAIRVSNALKAGTVWVNNYNMITQSIPFGGMKESGFGRELGKYALSSYTQVKSVRIRLAGQIYE